MICLHGMIKASKGQSSQILPFLCRVFPDIQFIVSTHSAFILNSIENAAIFDLENRPCFICRRSGR